MVAVFADDLHIVVVCVLAAHAQLLLNGRVLLRVGGIAGVDNSVHADSFLMEFDLWLCWTNTADQLAQRRDIIG